MRENLAIFIAAWLPRRIVYWCAVRVVMHATQHKSELAHGLITPAQCLKAWKEAK
jgi:hypothetical protein